MSNKSLSLKIIAAVSGFAGVMILTMVFVPILDYQGTLSPKYSKLLSPVIQSTQNVLSEANPQDFTKVSNWFEDSKDSDFQNSNVTYYTLSVPKLRIKDATVAIGGDDLSKHLVQYPGTALPGKRGNSVVFGHSVLPIFYNPKDYISIFSTVPNLKIGDEILVSYDGMNYKYKVETLVEVFPTDIQILEQDSSDSFISLVTCVPPGDPRKPKRLIVKARIVPPEV
jgi:sortase A